MLKLIYKVLDLEKENVLPYFPQETGSSYTVTETMYGYSLPIPVYIKQCSWEE